MIEAAYSADDMAPKAVNKRALQEQLGLEVRPDVPVIGIVSRLSSQKGLDLVDHVMADIMREDVQLAVLGMGDSRYINLFSWAEQNYPGRVAARYSMDHSLAHRIYAGSDIFLMPSQFEPCGLSQMISLLYGTVPIVRETGGLRDTVLSYNEYTGDGNGFSFFNYNAHDMLNTIRRALAIYRDKPDVWQLLMRRGMGGDYSWKHSAQMYVSLYQCMLSPEPPKDQQEEPIEEPLEENPPESGDEQTARKAESKTQTGEVPVVKAKAADREKPEKDKESKKGKAKK